MAGESDRMHGTRGLSGWDWKSKGGVPIVCVPGCPVLPDNFMETLLYLLYQSAGRSPMIPLDEALRPTWLFSQTVHEGCDRGGYYEQAQFAKEYGARECIVKLGARAVVQCNVGKRGWINGLGGCPNVGGICIGCTMPGFPDKFMPFIDQPPGSLLSSKAVMTYGKAIHALRRFTQASLNKEPSWRRRPPKKLSLNNSVNSDLQMFDEQTLASVEAAEDVLRELASSFPLNELKSSVVRLLSASVNKSFGARKWADRLVLPCRKSTPATAR